MAKEVSPKTASSVGKKNVSTSGNSSKKTNMTNATTSCNGIFLLSNSFEALNVNDPITVEVELGNKASTSCVQKGENSSTPLVEKIHRFEKQLLKGTCVLVDEDDIPLEKDDYSGDHGTKNFKPASVKPKTQYHPKVNQTAKEVIPKMTSSVGKKNVSTSGNSSKKTNMTNATTLCNRIFLLCNSFEDLNVDDPVTVEVESGNKASTSCVQEGENSSTPLVEKIHRFEKQLLKGTCVLVDEDDKHLEKDDYSGDHGSEYEVEPSDNEMTSFMASKQSGGWIWYKELAETMEGHIW
nr:hypothetical protein [Tanacetum cinerariifolium]